MISAAAREGSPLLIDEAACINIRGRMNICAACRDACAQGALFPSPDGIHLDSSRCTACGACVPNCPVGALRLLQFSPRDFLLALDHQPTAHLHCSASEDGARGSGVSIPCHSVLDARLLAAAYAAGTVSFLLHGLDSCGHCPKGNASAQVASMQASLRSWFAWEAPELIAASEDGQQARRWQQDRPSRSRRNFLRGAGLRATASAAAWLLPPGPESDAAPSVPSNLAQQRPAPYQALLQERVADLPWRLLPWQQLNIDGTCSVCLACAQRCPTGALTVWNKPAMRGIDFDLGLCTACRLCERVCPEQAISTGAAASVSDVVIGRIPLVTRQVASCTACRRTYVPGVPDLDSAGLCQACQKETVLKEEWQGLLGES